ADRGITEPRSEFQRVDTVVVDDAIQVDVPDIAFFGQLGFHFKKRAAEEQVGLAPEHGGAHFAGRRSDFAGEKLLVLEINVHRSDESLTVVKCADSNFHAVDAALQLEDLDFVGKSLFVGFQHADDVFAVFFFADEEPALYVLRFSAGFDDVAVGIFLDEFNGGVERLKILVRNDG